MHLIFERIWVKENAVVTVCLRPNYHVTVYRTGNLPTDVPHIFYQSGSDGHPPLITIWKVLVAPVTLATPPFAGCASNYSMSVN